MSQELVQQIQQLTAQNQALKARVFDAEENLKNQTQVFTSFINETAQLLGKEELNLQGIYDYIKEQVEIQEGQDSKEQQKTENSEDELLLEESDK